MTPVRMRPLRDILDEYLSKGETVDFLNVDVEGLDLSVLQSMDWDRHQPSVVAVEIHGLDLGDPKTSDTVRFMSDRGYGLASFAIVTAIFRKI